MARLPTVGGDDGNWGAVLNEYLEVGHNSDGTLNSVPSVFNVKDYGAVGDGVTDDTAAIQATIDAAHANGGGVVYFPPTTYQLSSGLTSYEKIALIGSNSGVHGAGTVLLKIDSGTGITFQKSPTCSLSYATICMENITLQGKSPSQKGVSMSLCRATFKNVEIQFFAGYGMWITGGINSLFTQVVINTCGTSLYIDPTFTNTTLSFQSCYFSVSTASCVIASNCNSLCFDQFCIFESCTGDAVILDDMGVATFYSPYFENVGGRCFYIGTTSNVSSLTARDVLAVGGAFNQISKEVFYLDDVKNADLTLAHSGFPKQTKLRTTANTGGVRFVKDDYVNNGGSPTTRANDTSYSIDDIINVTPVSGSTLRFICVTAGNSASSQPAEYVYGVYQVTDGTAVFQWSDDECIYDTSRTTVVLRNNVAKVGQMRFVYQNTGDWSVQATNDTSNGELDISNNKTGSIPVKIYPISDIVQVGSSAWNGGHFMIGDYHLWVDATGNLRIKSSAPASDTDGTVVGSQS